MVVTQQPAREVDFARPPVVEVALSVRFEPIRKLDSAQIALYWAGIKDRFPLIEQHPRLDSLIERFDTPDFTPSHIRLEFGEAVPRFWFLTSNQSQLLQLQQDQFAHNWRKNIDPYPHYESIRDSFRKEMDTFAEFVSGQRLGEVAPVQCEVTYINHIDAGDGDAGHAHVQDVLTVWSGQYNPGLPSEPETVDVRFRYLMNNDGKKVGRLHVELQPAFRQQDGRPIWVLIFTARGIPLGRDLPGAVAFMDLGRKNMLQTFLAITTTQLHKKWGRVG